MGNYEKIYNLSFEKIMTLEGLLDHIRNENYDEISFKKVDNGIKVSLNSQQHLNKNFECCFNKEEKLMQVFELVDNKANLIFDREYELEIERGLYSINQCDKVSKII